MDTENDMNKKGIFGWKRIFLLLFILYGLWINLQNIPVADLWWQLKTGEIIVKTGQIPATDIFSYTAGGMEWINHEWLAEVIFYHLWSRGGFFLLYVFKILMILGAFLIAFINGLKRNVNITALSLAGIWMLLVSGGTLYFDIRPYLFSYLFLAMTIHILENAYNKGKSGFILWLIPITLFWTNCHGAFILIFILQGLYLFIHLSEKIRIGEHLPPLILFLTGIALAFHHAEGALLMGLPFIFSAVYVYAGKQSSEKNKRAGKNMVSIAGLTLITCLLSGLINPYGIKIYSYPFSFIGPSFYRENLIEWIPPDLLGKNLPLFISVYLLLFACSYFPGKRIRTADMTIFCMFSYLALTVVRHSALFAIALLPVAGTVIQGLWADIFRKKLYIPETIIKMLILPIYVIITITGLLLFVMPGPWRIDYRNLNMEKVLFPVAGVEFISRNSLPAPIYNPYEWGGYLIWKLYPAYKVFCDGRANTVYPEDTYRDSLEITRGDENALRKLDRYGINTVITNKYLDMAEDRTLSRQLEESPVWKMIYEDETEKIFLRNNSKNSVLIRQAEEGKLHRPETPFSLSQQATDQIRHDNPAMASKAIQKALNMNPDHLPSLYTLGYLLLTRGDEKNAERVYRHILSIEPDYPGINYNLALMHEKRGDTERAIRYLRNEIRIDPDFIPARTALDRLTRGK